MADIDVDGTRFDRFDHDPRNDPGYDPDDWCEWCHRAVLHCVCDPDGHAYEGNGTSRCKVCGGALNAHDPALSLLALDGAR